MCDLGDALTRAGNLVFFAFGLRVDEQTMTPHMRAACRPDIVRKLPEDAWQIIRMTMIKEIDSLRSAPLDDLERE